MILKDYIEDLGIEEAVILDGLDNCAIAFDIETNKIIYDYDKIVDHFQENDGMDYEEAIEWVDYNVVRTCQYISNPPIISRSIL